MGHLQVQLAFLSVFFCKLSQEQQQQEQQQQQQQQQEQQLTNS